jgi:hypothetical protein
MMDQLGIKALRRGADPNNQSTFDEATANPYKMPPVDNAAHRPVRDHPTRWDDPAARNAPAMKPRRAA